MSAPALSPLATTQWFKVHTPFGRTLSVEAHNWIEAFGLALQRTERAPPVRIAMETLQNGDALIRDTRSGESWVVRPSVAPIRLLLRPEAAPDTFDAVGYIEHRWMM